MAITPSAPPHGGPVPGISSSRRTRRGGHNRPGPLYHLLRIMSIPLCLADGACATQQTSNGFVPHPCQNARETAVINGDHGQPHGLRPGHAQVDPLPETTSSATGRGAARVAVSVAVHRRTGGSTRDRPRALVQAEPIWTAATRAANAVRVRALPGFKSPSLRTSQALSPGIRGEGLPRPVRPATSCPACAVRSSLDQALATAVQAAERDRCATITTSRTGSSASR
jgi:hypothetical protein